MPHGSRASIALIGIILLIGIVKKNAIMMIDFALEAERKEGKTPLEAIYQACLLRFRPIMMTTMAALLGGLPLALGTGVGSELRRPLGITIVGGLILSQLLTLYTTPVVYSVFDQLARRVWRRFHITNAAEPRRKRTRRARRAIHDQFLAPFIRRPVATSLISIAILLAGGDCVSVSAGGAAAAGGIPDHQRLRTLPGASPETMASSVATPLERQFGRIAGVTEMTSTSQLGSTNITLQFDLNRNIDAAARDVQAAINAARGQLPDRSSEQADLPEGESSRRADHAAVVTSDNISRARDLRRRGFHPRAKVALRSTASVRSSSAVAQSRPCACK